jgi:hypothetical protein
LPSCSGSCRPRNGPATPRSSCPSCGSSQPRGRAAGSSFATAAVSSGRSCPCE